MFESLQGRRECPSTPAYLRGRRLSRSGSEVIVIGPGSRKIAWGSRCVEIRTAHLDEGGPYRLCDQKLPNLLDSIDQHRVIDSYRELVPVSSRCGDVAWSALEPPGDSLVGFRESKSAAYVENSQRKVKMIGRCSVNGPPIERIRFSRLKQ
jgi:hypothetical protein